jgi:hypothetical protein
MASINMMFLNHEVIEIIFIYSCAQQKQSKEVCVF